MPRFSLPTAITFAALFRSSVADKTPTDESKLQYPRGPLPWGDVNFVHTTDIHGWLLGHQHNTWPEPNYSGNTGDVLSFITHLRKIAHERGSDLLLVDSGDHHDGTGLVSAPPLISSNGSHPSGGEIVDRFLSELEYDVLAIGNHELYKYPDAREVSESAPTGEGKGKAGRWNKGKQGRYLTSNVNITLPSGVDRPIGERVAKFKTDMGRSVTAFGILYDFRGNAKNTTVQSPADLVKKPWFLDAISERPDFFILAGHMSVNHLDSQWDVVLQTIRERHEDVPVFIFGGHTHVRNCMRLDGNSVTFAGGRYMETVGWVSANLTQHTAGGIDISRRYIDNNRRSFKYHSQVPEHKFDTDHGLALTDALWDTHSHLNLTTVLGHAPQDYFLARYPVTDDRSLLKKLMDDVLPAMIVDDKVIDGSGRKRIYVANSGCQRFDLFHGPFTADDQYSISPFTSRFVQILLPARIARVLRQTMNEIGASNLMPGQTVEDLTAWKAYNFDKVQQWEAYQASLPGSDATAQKVFSSGRQERRYGYVTRDSCGPVGSGDDTIHIPVPHAPVPDYVSTTFPADIVDDDEEVFVISMDFFIGDVINAVHQLEPAYPRLTAQDFVSCGDEKMMINEIWGHYASKYWN